MFNSKKIHLVVFFFRVGLYDDYFGKLTIGKTSFEFNLSLLLPLECFNGIEIEEVNDYRDLFQITLMDENSKIPLSSEEYHFFHEALLEYLKYSHSKFGIFSKFLLGSNFNPTPKLIEILNAPKFNCQIN